MRRHPKAVTTRKIDLRDVPMPVELLDVDPDPDMDLDGPSEEELLGHFPGDSD